MNYLPPQRNECLSPNTVVGAARRGLTWKENNPALQFQIANEESPSAIKMEQRQSLAQIEAWETQCQLSTPGLETVTAPEPDGRASCSGFSPKPADGPIGSDVRQHGARVHVSVAG